MLYNYYMYSSTEYEPYDVIANSMCNEFGRTTLCVSHKKLNTVRNTILVGSQKVVIYPDYFLIVDKTCRLV